MQSVRVSAAYPVTIPTHGLVTWRIRTISPITVYQSESKDSNSAHYFAPDDPLFSKIVLDNAVRKYYAWTQEKAPSDGFSISCLDHTPHLAVISFKDTPVHGYTGRFQLTGDAKLLSFLYESGLGGKNSHGFGMFDIAPEGEDDAHWRRRTEEESREVRRAPSTPMAAADQERPDPIGRRGRKGTCGTASIMLLGRRVLEERRVQRRPAACQSPAYRPSVCGQAAHGSLCVRPSTYRADPLQIARVPTVRIRTGRARNTLRRTVHVHTDPLRIARVPTVRIRTGRARNTLLGPSRTESRGLTARRRRSRGTGRPGSDGRRSSLRRVVALLIAEGLVARRNRVASSSAAMLPTSSR